MSVEAVAQAGFERGVRLFLLLPVDLHSPSGALLPYSESNKDEAEPALALVLCFFSSSCLLLTWVASKWCHSASATLATGTPGRAGDKVCDSCPVCSGRGQNLGGLHCRARWWVRAARPRQMGTPYARACVRERGVCWMPFWFVDRFEANGDKPDTALMPSLPVGAGEELLTCCTGALSCLP